VGSQAPVEEREGAEDSKLPADMLMGEELVAKVGRERSPA